MIDRKGHAPHIVRCDYTGCKNTYHGAPWQRAPEARRAANGEGWRSAVIKHNDTPGGFGTRRIDDLCPTHKDVEWKPRRKR